jgi:S-adenosylmethionine synthetase
VSVNVNTYGTAKVKLSDAEIGEKVNKLFDLRPAKIVARFGLKYPIFEATAAYGHFGRDCVKKKVELRYNGKKTTKEVEFFSWEKLDAVPAIKAAFFKK